MAHKVRIVVVSQLPAGRILALSQPELDVNQTALTRHPRRHGDSSKWACRNNRLLLFNISSACVFPPDVWFSPEELKCSVAPLQTIDVGCNFELQDKSRHWALLLSGSECRRSRSYCMALAASLQLLKTINICSSLYHISMQCVAAIAN